MNSNSQKHDLSGALGGIYLSPISKTQFEISDKHPFFPMRKHEEIVLARVISGKGTINLNGKLTEIGTDMLALITPFTFYSFLNSDSLPFTLDAIAINLRTLDKDSVYDPIKSYSSLLNSGQVKSRVISADDKNYARLKNTFDALSDFKQAEREKTLSDVRALIFVVNEICLKSNRPTDEKLLHTMTVALNLVCNQYKYDLSAKQLGEQCGYDECHAMKVFKAFTSFPFIRYLNNYRLSLASQYLLDTTKDIYRIAVAVGYNNVSYFNRQFLRLFKVTPTEYRLAYSANFTASSRRY